MAGQAVVNERAGAALQRRLVAQINLYGVELDVLPAGSEAHTRQRRTQQNENRLLLFVTLSGTGLVLSILVYHGISAKKAKYTIVKICAQYTFAKSIRLMGCGLLLPR